MLKLKIIDEIIPEPLGGAHRDSEQIAKEIKKSILKNLVEFENLSGNQIFEQRKNRFLKRCSFQYSYFEISILMIFGLVHAKDT